MYYIIREFKSEAEPDTLRFHLMSHSELSKDGVVTSKYYVWDKLKAATAYCARLQHEDKLGHKFEVVTTEDYGIEVR